MKGELKRERKILVDQQEKDKAGRNEQKLWPGRSAKEEDQMASKREKMLSVPNSKLCTASLKQ